MGVGVVVRCALLALGLAAAGAARAEPPAAAPSGDAARAIEERDRKIEELSERLERLEGRLERIEGPAAADEETPTPEPEVPSGEQVGPEPAADAAEGDVLEVEDDTEKDRLIAGAFEQTLIERGGLLLPWRTYNLELGLTYIHSSSDNIVVDGFTLADVIVIGDIVSEKVERDLTLLNLTARLGLPWDSQLELRVPYGFLRHRGFAADGEQFSRTDAGIGDVEVGLSHQLYRSKGTWPDLLGSFTWKFDTGQSPFTADDGEIFVGTGYDAANFSLTGVKVVDPVVYFAGGSYTHNLSTHENGGKFEPGGTGGFNVGMAIALNLNTSLSLAYDQQMTRKSRFDGHKIPGSYSTVGVVSFGSTYSFRDFLSLDFSVGVGVTSDSPDVLVRLTLPFRGSF